MGRGKKIADAVHGTVQLSELESEVISTPAFQRLRGIKHLGMASLVFPGADYSRFSHGVGTSHITARILESLSSTYSGRVTDDDIALYRMAALLHDIGHYPYSHTFERALKNHYSKTGLLKTNEEATPPDLKQPYMYHEEAGTRVIETDQHLARVLEQGGIDRTELEHIITRVEPPKFANLVSSDLDADRIDYMMRTALHTGLPYGHVDLDYLLTQIRLDDADRICLAAKGMRAAEHMLLARFFDYTQVSFHKTVQALELVLNEAVEALLRHGTLDCSVSAIENMISDGRWCSFDDAHILNLIRTAASSGDFESSELALFRSVLDRNPPKLVFGWEQFGSSDDQATKVTIEKMIKRHIEVWQAEFGVRMWDWSRSTSLTKVGQSVPLSRVQDDSEAELFDKIQQAVLILRDDGATAVTLQETRSSMVSVLSDKALHAVRVYALLPAEDDRVDVIRQRIRYDVGDLIG